MTQPLHTVRQLGYFVKDLDEALKYWTEVLKVGPFFKMEHLALENQVYRGNPGNVDLTIALGNSGSVQIELIQQINDAPSVYKEFVDAGRGGLHHFGIMPEDYQSTRQQYIDHGHEAVFECTLAGAPLVYFDTLDTLGHYTELWDNNDFYKDLFMEIENAAKDWDGKDPVRTLEG